MVSALPVPTLDYATCDPSALSSRSLKCCCACCERTGGGLWFRMAALAGRGPLDASSCRAIPVLHSRILDHPPALVCDAD